MIHIYKVMKTGKLYTSSQPKAISKNKSRKAALRENPKSNSNWWKEAFHPNIAQQLSTAELDS
jgi:hypothetical protein